ncbi:MAG: nitroreductase family protein [Chloroflexota bacterium]|nr:MAG: nitroreductase family protein [Chloroflexota bacterium]
MRFQELIHRRYSVRDYLPKEIDPTLLNLILTAAQFAPTAANRQPFRLIVISTAGKQDQLREIYDREWFVNAPIIICACGIPEIAWVREDGKLYLDADIAIVMDHVSLAAADLGLGSCWVASFQTERARDILQIPDDAEPIVFMSLGYPAGEPEEKERKPIEELVAYETWFGQIAESH